MNGFKQLVAVVILVAVTIPCALLAQDVVDELPVQYSTATVDQWFGEDDRRADSRWRERVFERFEAELADGRYLAILSELAEDCRTTVGRHGGKAGAVFQMEFDSLVGRYRAALHEAALSDAVDTVVQRSAVLEAMGDRGAESLLPGLIADDLGFPMAVFFAGTENEITLYETTAEDRFRLLVPPDVVRSLRLRGDAVRAVFMDFVDPVQRMQYAAIMQANRRWESYLDNGYSQYPWEALFNGKVLNFSAFNPPDKQWVILHPSIAIEVSTPGLDEMTAKEVLNLELLGFLAYFGKNSEHFLGISVAAVLRDDLRPGFGPVLHLGKDCSLGVAWHDLDGNDRLDEDPYIFLSLDFFRFFQSEGSKFQDEYEKAKAFLK